MIILPQHIFIHSPKTAGSSFEKMMWDRHSFPVYGHQHNTPADIPSAHLHKSVFGFMRDPLIAECSNWRYHHFAWKAPKMTFEEWCEWRYGDKPEEYGNRFDLTEAQVQYGYKFNVRPSAGYFCDATGKCVADRIWRYESLGWALGEVSKMLGINCSIEGFGVMEYNWSRGREKYAQHITPRAEELVRKAKAIDFEIHSADGYIPLDYSCPMVQNYADSR